MKKVWKWVIGIAVGLVIIAALVGAGILIRNNFHALRTEPVERAFSRDIPRLMPFGGFNPHMQGPMTVRRGFNVFGGFIRGLFSLGFLALIVLGIIWFIKSLRTPKPVAAVAGPQPAATNPCKKCGNPLQAEWKHCPNCGKKV